MPTAFIYIRVSTPAQQVDEQFKEIGRYAEEHDIEIIGRYGDYEKRHKAHKRQSFQSMLTDLEVMKPDYILVQRMDRFGTNGPNELGSFLTKLKENKVKLITTIDGTNRSKEDIGTVLQNMISSIQSRQEQIDKSERVLTGKRAKAILGEYVGSKYLCYGFDLVCIGANGDEKWRLVEDGWGVRIKYVLNNDGEYVEAEQYGNEIIKDPNGIMPDKEVRHRCRKDTSDKEYYSPSIREERVETIKRICEWFAQGWTTYRIAKQLNDEGLVKPIFRDHWYSSLIDGIIENSVLVGRPTWGKTSQSHFREIVGNKIVEPNEEEAGKWRKRKVSDWMQPVEEIHEPIIDSELFTVIQHKLQARRIEGKRNPRSDNLWFAGLLVCETCGKKLAGDNAQRCLRCKTPSCNGRKVTFKETEWLLSEYLDEIGTRIETLGESVGTKKVLQRLTTEEWLTDLKLEYIRLQLEEFIAGKIKEGLNRIGGVEIIKDFDDEDGSPIITTDGDLLEIYAMMVQEDREENKASLIEKIEERDRLTKEFIDIKSKNETIIRAYTERIDQLSKEIKEATDPFDYRAWIDEVVDEMQLLEQQISKVRKSIAEGSLVNKANAVRSIIDRIECHWTIEATTDKRYRDGLKTYCSSVTIHPVSKQEQQGKVMTIATPLASSW